MGDVLVAVIIVILIALAYYYYDAMQKCAAEQSTLEDKISVLQDTIVKSIPDTSSTETPPSEGYTISKDRLDSKNRVMFGGGSYDYTKFGDRLLKENLEYFEVANTNTDGISKVQADGCGQQEAFTPGLSDTTSSENNYGDYLTDVALDPSTKKYHQAFLKDQLKNNPGAYKTGRSYAPDSEDMWNEVPYVGMYRPRRVDRINPTTLSDVDDSKYRTTAVNWR